MGRDPLVVPWAASDGRRGILSGFLEVNLKKNLVCSDKNGRDNRVRSVGSTNAEEGQMLIRVSKSGPRTGKRLESHASKRLRTSFLLIDSFGDRRFALKGSVKVFVLFVCVFVSASQ